LGQLTNTLQRKLNEVRREKALLEKQMIEQQRHETSSSSDQHHTPMTSSPVTTSYLDADLSPADQEDCIPLEGKHTTNSTNHLSDDVTSSSEITLPDSKRMKTTTETVAAELSKKDIQEKVETMDETS
jgi:hypothetical protein